MPVDLPVGSTLRRREGLTSEEISPYATISKYTNYKNSNKTYKYRLITT